MATVFELSKAPQKVSDSQIALNIFRKYIFRDSKGDLNCEGVLSRKCFEEWVKSNKTKSLYPERVKGGDKRERAHFGHEEEASLILELKKKRIWPCFEGTTYKIGLNGFRTLGWHERKFQEEIRSRRHVRRNAQACAKKCNTQKNILHKENSEPETEELKKIKRASKSERRKRIEGNEETQRALSSYEVFIEYAPADETGCSRILSKECYDTWVSTRRNGAKNPEHSFRKALIAHLCGRDGRRPFPRDLEILVVAELRKKQVWPCFYGRSSKSVLNIGNKGFRHMGYHEANGKEILPAENIVVSKPQPKKRKKIAQNQQKKSKPRKRALTEDKQLKEENATKNVPPTAHSSHPGNEEVFPRFMPYLQFPPHQQRHQFSPVQTINFNLNQNIFLPSMLDIAAVGGLDSYSNILLAQLNSMVLQRPELLNPLPEKKQRLTKLAEMAADIHQGAVSIASLSQRDNSLTKTTKLTNTQTKASEEAALLNYFHANPSVKK